MQWCLGGVRRLVNVSAPVEQGLNRHNVVCLDRGDERLLRTGRSVVIPQYFLGIGGLHDDRPIQGGSLGLILDREVGATVYQQLEDVRVVLLGCHDHRRKPVLILHIEVCLVRDEQIHNVEVTALYRQQKRVIPKLILLVNIRPGVDVKLHPEQVSSPDDGVQRGRWGLDACARLKQEVDDFRLVPGDGKIQRRALAGVLHVRVRTGIEQQRHDLHAVYRDGIVKRSRAGFTQFVEVGGGVNERFDRIHVAVGGSLPNSVLLSMQQGGRGDSEEAQPQAESN